jgi:hypothetical protein
MSRFYARLKQDWPEPTEPIGGSVLGNANLLAEWIAQLPLANAESSQRLLHKLLGDLVSMRMDPGVRLNALEQLRGPVATVNGAVERQILGMAFPLPPAKARVAALSRDIDHMMAQGYRQAVVDFCAPAGRIPFLRGKQVLTAIERGLMHGAAVIEQGYLVYAQPPARAWSTLHALIGFARELGLDAKPVPDPLLGNLECTARMRYAQACVLALGNPYRLNQREIADAARLAQAWSAQIRLVAGAGTVTVDLDRDDGPGYLPDERRAAVADGLGLDLSELEADIDRRLAGAGSAQLLEFGQRGGIVVQANPALAARLRAYWTQGHDRVAERLPAGYGLDSVIGFNAVHAVLGSQLDFAELVLGPDGAGGYGDLDAGAWTASDTQRIDVVRATVLDQSLRGYRLVWEAGDAVRVKVGEVVALSFVGEDERRRDWMVGLVRWMRIGAEGRVDAGIELLSRRARAASLRPLEGTARAPTRALWLDLPVDADPVRPAPGTGRVLASSSIDRAVGSFELRRAPGVHPGDDGPETFELVGWPRAEVASAFVVIGPPSA